MDEKQILSQELDEIQQQLKDLEIRYEQYFAGHERREPYNERKELTARLHYFTNRKIVWSDLKYRYQNIATRFMTYNRYWDRVLREIEEGRFQRSLGSNKRSTQPTVSARTTTSEARQTAQSPYLNEAQRLQKELIRAGRSLGNGSQPPTLGKIVSYLARQREEIRGRYGEREVRFSVAIKEGKPHICAKLKQE